MTMLASCVKETIYNTPYPDSATAEFTTLWSNLHTGESAPSSYVLYVGEDRYDISDVNTTLILEPISSESFLVYNTPSGITITDGVATLGEAARVAVDPEPEPGSLYYGRLELDLIKDNVMNVTVTANRGTAPLTITLDYKSSEVVNIKSAVATLSGVAASRNLRTDALLDPVTLTHYAVVDAAKSELTLNYNLLGVVSSSQILTLTYTTVDGQTKVVEADLSAQLANFNSNLSPLSLRGNMYLPTDLESEGSISDWNQVNGGDSSAD